MATDDYKLQVSIRSTMASNSDMINIRANTVEELSILLEGISDYSTQIAATARMITGAYVVSPLATTSSTPVTQATPTFVTAPAQAPSSTPTCVHGARSWKTGVSPKNGKPYAMWVCPLPMGVDQCKPVN